MKILHFLAFEMLLYLYPIFRRILFGGRFGCLIGSSTLMECVDIDFLFYCLVYLSRV